MHPPTAPMATAAPPPPPPTNTAAVRRPGIVFVAGGTRWAYNPYDNQHLHVFNFSTERPSWSRSVRAQRGCVPYEGVHDPRVVGTALLPVRSLLPSDVFTASEAAGYTPSSQCAAGGMGMVRYSTATLSTTTTSSAAPPLPHRPQQLYSSPLLRHECTIAVHNMPSHADVSTLGPFLTGLFQLALKEALASPLMTAGAGPDVWVSVTDITGEAKCCHVTLNFFIPPDFAQGGGKAVLKHFIKHMKSDVRVLFDLGAVAWVGTRSSGCNVRAVDAYVTALGDKVGSRHSGGGVVMTARERSGIMQGLPFATLKVEEHHFNRGAARGR